MSAAQQELKELIARHGLDGGTLKEFFKDAVKRNWPGFPSFSPYSTEKKDGPLIQEVPTASIGSGVVITWKKNGVRKVLLGQAGEHYAELYRRNPKNTAPFPDSFTIPGGFVNLTYTRPSAFVPASDKPETGFTGAVAEIEEEFKVADGSEEGKPLLCINPDRLRPMDTVSMKFPNGNCMVVMGSVLEAEDEEISVIEEHVKRLETDQTYKESSAWLTRNTDSGLPEICGKKIFDLDDVVDGRVNLLHKDQISLFAKVKAHFDALDTPRRRVGPMLSVQEKIKDVAGLEEIVSVWRQNGAKTIGITSGAFDILHPGHTSFLEDASRHCDRLIAVVASDRTVSELKGADKPRIKQDHRAQVISALSSVDAVIISDEFDHASILRPIHPDVMFKGHDYAGKDMWGKQWVGKIQIIPCAEDKFYSSAHLIREIQGAPLEPFAPSPAG